MVPKGWILKELQTIISGNIKNGFSPLASDSKTGYWVLGLGALSDDGIKIDEIKPVEPTKKVIDSVLSKGDFLVSRSNTPDKVGRSIQYKGEIDNCSYPDLMMKFRVDKAQVYPLFVEHQLKSSVVRAYFKMCASGSSKSMVKINKKVLEKTPLLVPPLVEQQKIAKILSTWDKAISTTERLIENSTQQKKALMQQLLTGKKRLLDESGKRFEREWEEVELGEISHITTGSSNREDSSLTGEYAFFDRSIDVRTSGIFLFDAEAIIVGGEGQDFVPKYFEGKFDLHQRTYAIMDFKNTYGKFLFYYIGYYRHYFLSQAVGSTVKSLRLPMFQKMPVKLPSAKEQQKIASVLTNADKEIELLEQQLADLQQEKKALMQVLLTGKKRVVVDA
ncbi:restriction endonuclease subunit S [Psychrobacter sp. 5A.1]|uniref:restriction endonuclease subunit S n=1 Tax=Psychrobacter sp. 5A.1 TaxID=3035207 RepID=UPI0025B36B3B|nr:restriction endonuclease subunit S [Psychrobacter sp. 5A.1]MDN3503188.1 restriction endonuclease subunit S [Psychrobacter sp. 5A.1]